MTSVEALDLVAGEVAWIEVQTEAKNVSTNTL